MGRRWETWLLVRLQLLLGALLLFSAYQKLSPGVVNLETRQFQTPGPFTFALAVKSFELVPIAWVPTFASIVAWTEAVTGLALVLGLWTRAAGLLALLMLLAFTTAVISVILRGMNLSCGCFGRFKFFCDGPVGWCKVGENLVLIAVAYVVALRGHNGLGLQSQEPNGGSPPAGKAG